MVYHLFNYCIQGIWYRDSFSLSDDDFERIMNALEGKVPANVKIYITMECQGGNAMT